MNFNVLKKWSLFLNVSMAVYRRRQWHPTPVLLPGKSHGWRSLVGCSPRGLEDSDTTERLNFHFSLSCIGEGNGNPLRCSCLENPTDGEAWWAAVYEVTQSSTRLKWLSSSSSITKLSLHVRRQSRGLSRNEEGLWFSLTGNNNSVLIELIPLVFLLIDSDASFHNRA